MTVTATELPGRVVGEDDPFDLDIRFIEHGPMADTLMIPSTDDGCGSSCPNACTTSAV
jgi:FxLD family lantipeptide